MTLKELLENFIEFLDGEQYDICLGSLTIASIEKFLEHHHKEYYPVGIVKRGSPEGDTLELMNTVQDFKQCLNEETT